MQKTQKRLSTLSINIMNNTTAFTTTSKHYKKTQTLRRKKLSTLPDKTPERQMK
jgi:hypothetical protein